MSDNNQNIVSVVIPTLNRPHLVTRAIESALAQTLDSIEVIVVVDGPDPATVKELEKIEDPRVRVIELPVNVGLAGARNAGVQAAKGTWIAFLDDDDEWLPQKLERQLELAQNSSYKFPVVSSRFIARTPKGDFIWPRRLPSSSEPMGDYLFVRNSLFLGEGLVTPSTWFIKKELLLKMPFEKNKHEDWYWLLQVSLLEGMGIAFFPDSMVIKDSNREAKRLSNINDWQDSLNWIRSVRHLITPRAYSGFIVTIVSPQASLERDWKVFWYLLWEAIRLGNPRIRDYFLYLVMWLIPSNVRQQVRAFFTKERQDKLLDSAS